MKFLSHLRWLRLRRRRCKSQAFVEFALILPIFLTLVMAVFDYSFMIMRMQVMAMAAREAAITATREPAALGNTVGLSAAYSAARSAGLDFSSTKGGVIITHVWYSTNYISDPNLVLLLDSNYIGSSAPAGSPSDYTNPAAAIPANAVSSMGGIYGGGTSLLNKSRILTNGSSWSSPYRQLPIPGADLVDSDIRGVYAVEVMYTNAFITPVGAFLSGLVAPSQLYDAAYYSVITPPIPTAFVGIPPPDTVPPVFTKPKKHSPRATPGIPAPTHVAPGTGNNRATPAVPGPHIKNPKPGTDPGGGG